MRTERAGGARGEREPGMGMGPTLPRSHTDGTELRGLHLHPGTESPSSKRYRNCQVWGTEQSTQGFVPSVLGQAKACPRVGGFSCTETKGWGLFFFQCLGVRLVQKAAPCCPALLAGNQPSPQPAVLGAPAAWARAAAFVLRLKVAKKRAK